MDLHIIEEYPIPEEYLKLRKEAGLSAKSLEAARVGLPNSLYAVQVRLDKELIAMGRVIGDGACFFEIVDIAVSPRHQGKGLGRKVMEHIEEYLKKATYVGSYISLIADEPKFYEKFGYQLTSPSAQGMFKRLKPTLDT